MRRLLLGLGLLLAACGPADDKPAAHTPARPGGASEVDGVSGATWGMTAEQLIVARGTPAFREQAFEGVEVMGYVEPLADQPAQLLYMVHPDRGVFRAGYLLAVTEARHCAATMDALDRELEEKYGGMEVTAARMGSSDAPPCDAFAAGSGGYLKTRRAPSGNRILLGLTPGSGGIMLTYSTPAADEWEQRAKAARR